MRGRHSLERCRFLERDGELCLELLVDEALQMEKEHTQGECVMKKGRTHDCMTRKHCAGKREARERRGKEQKIAEEPLWEQRKGSENPFEVEKI
jgi:hypothetical protein